MPDYYEAAETLFRSFAKNLPIAKVFREIGLADELGSGMRNSYKNTKMYSGGEPVFTEADIFMTIILLSEAATAMVGLLQREKIRSKSGIKIRSKSRCKILFNFAPFLAAGKKCKHSWGWPVEETFQKNILILCLRWERLKVNGIDRI